jgi:hypothetical protein
MVLLVSALIGGSAQDLVLTYGDRIVTNDTLHITGLVTTEYFEAKISVTDNRETAVVIKVRKTVIQCPARGENSFCWGECYTPAVNLSPSRITIPSKATDRTSFIADYRPNGDVGASIVRYTFFSSTEESFQASIFIVWEIGAAGTGPLVAAKPVIRVYPNPADQFMTVTLSEHTTGTNTALMVNMQGQTVISAVIDAGEHQFTWQTGNLASGIYFLKVRDQAGLQSVQKVWIKR